MGWAARGSAAALTLGLLPPAIRRALALPATRRSGSLADVGHVVILTQENRSFDHYFGTLRGVRGFGDRFPIPLPGGRTVWQQRDPLNREVQPYRLDTTRTSAQRVQGTPHTWPDAQQAWGEGRMDQWLAAKTARSLGHYAAQDIPFQFALANAFTICDAYHCSMHGGTNPNRLFLWSGHNDPRGEQGGPALVNTFEDLGPAHEGYDWTTYPERLEQAGVSWKQYQDMADNYADNPLEGFRRFRAAQPGSPLHRKALSSHSLDDLARDVARGELAQVSWVIAPAKSSEHPDPSSPLQGAEYTARVLDALTANPQVWGRTVLFINFDENDGFFDHVAPPAPPSRDSQGRLLGGSTAALDGEYHDARRGPSLGSADDPPAYHGRPFGLGPRVPLYVVSPWSRGGWVDSQVYDHTSILRFLERRFGVAEPHISPWRRAVCGDLSSAFDFSLPSRARLPRLPRVADADARVEAQSHLPPPLPPPTAQRAVQQPGLRRSRALPYVLDVQESWSERRDALVLRFLNRGRAGAVFHVYDRLAPEGGPPQRYTVEPGRSLHGSWPLREAAPAAYDLQVHGPNGFFRAYRGTGKAALPELSTEPGALGQLRIMLRNPVARVVQLEMQDHYGGPAAGPLPCVPGLTAVVRDLTARLHWDDYGFTAAADGAYLRRVAGRIETGRDGGSDIGLASAEDRARRGPAG